MLVREASSEVKKGIFDLSSVLHRVPGTTRVHFVVPGGPGRVGAQCAANAVMKDALSREQHCAPLITKLWCWACCCQYNASRG